MKSSSKILLAALLAIFITGHSAFAGGQNRIGVSFVLSGHLMFGLKFQHYFDSNQNVQVTFFPLLMPGKKFPFALTTGYNYFIGQGKWQTRVGAEFALIVSPPDPDKRKILPMINLTPGFRYNRTNEQSLSGSIWVSYFLKKTRKPIFPTGVELWYNFKK
ncbi:hypothetical protein [Caldithrix abyssi]